MRSRLCKLRLTVLLPVWTADAGGHGNRNCQVGITWNQVKRHVCAKWFSAIGLWIWSRAALLWAVLLMFSRIIHLLLNVFPWCRATSPPSSDQAISRSRSVVSFWPRKYSPLIFSQKKLIFFNHSFLLSATFGNRWMLHHGPSSLPVQFFEAPNLIST